MKSITIKSVPDEVHEAMKELADVHHRSLNGEIIHCLEKYAQTKRLNADELIRQARELRKGIKHQFTAEEIKAAIEEGRE